MSTHPSHSLRHILRQSPQPQNRVTLPALSYLLNSLSDDRRPPQRSSMSGELIDLTADSSPPPVVVGESSHNTSSEPARKRRRTDREDSSDAVSAAASGSRDVRLPHETAPTIVDLTNNILPTPSRSREARVPDFTIHSDPRGLNFITIDDLSMDMLDNILDPTFDVPQHPSEIQHVGRMRPEALEAEEDVKKAQAEQKRRHGAQKARDQLQQQAVASQRPEPQGPPTLSNLNCTICLSTVTDLTATHCGHLFCHECLIGALVAGERQDPHAPKSASRCPICRKPVSRKPKKGNEFVPLEIKIRKKSDKAMGKQRATGTVT